MPDTTPPPVAPLPEGDYAIVEQLGHRTFVGRVEEVERFGTKMLQIEPVYQGRLLDAMMIGGGSIFAFTPCTAEIALKRGPTQPYNLPPSLVATLPTPALAAPAPIEPDRCTCDFENFSEGSDCPVHDADGPRDFAPRFLDDDDDAPRS